MARIARNVAIYFTLGKASQPTDSKREHTVMGTSHDAT